MKKWVCVRVTDLRGVDLSVYSFDYDLTFAALLMNADGTIYHTWGGRTAADANSHLNVPTLVGLLDDTLAEHEAYEKAPDPPERTAARRPEDLPWIVRREREKRMDCIHCHQVNEAIVRHAQAEKTFTRDLIWNWPDPIQVGLEVDSEDQSVVAAVADGSAARRAGLRAGDRLVRLGGIRIATFGDVQRALHEASGDATVLEAVWTRDGKETEGKLRLEKGWKAAEPRVFAWRPTKWPLSPKPGFGGKLLTADEKRRLGLEPERFALRVGYVVTWGPAAYTGRNAQRAGIRKGDVILSVGGKDDFDSPDHFHAWYRLTRRPGDVVEVVRLRDGKRETLHLTVLR